MDALILGVSMYVAALNPPKRPIEDALARLAREKVAMTTTKEAPARITVAARRSRTERAIAIGAGLVMGSFAGGATGFYLTQDRDRDDDGTSGLRGMAVGVPIGAVAGAVVGWRLSR